jgi:hypothetical protein
MHSLGEIDVDSAVKRLLTYKQLGDRTLAQLDEQDIHFTPNEASNSIAVIVRHLHGNMMSRWTHFLTEDGEKEGRNRDAEFSPPAIGYPHHVGQIVYIGKMIRNGKWQSLSIPKGASGEFNQLMKEEQGDRDSAG